MTAAGCALGVRRATEPLVPMRPASLPPLADDAELASLRQAIARTAPAWRKHGQAGAQGAAQRLLDVLAAGGDAREALADGFDVARVREPVLMTSYYEPEIAARARPDTTFRFPVYGRPSDLVDVDPAALDADCRCRKTAGRVDAGRLAPYDARAAIDAGALAGRGLEIAWTDDPVALFLMQVQGSGRLRFADRVQPVGFAGTNGLPYRALGAILVAHGVLSRDHATVPGIRRALAALPEARQRALMAENPRYVFFRPTTGGAVGSLGVELTAGRSIATDPTLVPPGSIAYLVTPRLRRFVVAQDAGAAITGPHVDLFAGSGPEAEEFAGSARERGVLYVFTPR